MKYFYYISGDIVYPTLIRVKARRRPGRNTMSRSGTWVLSELSSGKWVMPCCPEVSWMTLEKCLYIGNTEVKP